MCRLVELCFLVKRRCCINTMTVLVTYAIITQLRARLIQKIPPALVTMWYSKGITLVMTVNAPTRCVRIASIDGFGIIIPVFRI